MFLLQQLKDLFKILIWMALTFGSSFTFAYYDFTDESSFGYEQLQELIETRGLTSVEEVLAALKQEQPRFFEHFVLMYRSKSLQKGRFLAPRAILFDTSAQFVFTFNGDPTDVQGYNKLEIMQFRPETNRFEFREVAFSEGQPPQFSEPNPAKCLRCHQSPDRRNIDPRPNWEPYNTWPGAYGSDSGRLEPMDRWDIERKGLGDEDAQHIADQAREREMFERFFKEVKPEHPRYRFLGHEELSGQELSEAEYNRKADDVAHFGVELTEYFGQLNSRRILRIMKEEWAPQWEYLKYTVGGIAKCSKLYMTEENIAWHRERTPNEFITRPPERRSYSTVDPLERYRYEMRKLDPTLTDEELDVLVEGERRRLEAIPEYPSLKHSEAFWLLYEPLGISINDWSMDFQTQGRLAFYERFGLPSNFQTAFSNAARRVIPEVYQLGCEELERLSLEKMAEYRQTNLFAQTIAQRRERERNRQPLIHRCISCHVEDAEYTNIPAIPFNDEEALREELTAGPPGYTLLDDIRERLGDHATLENQMPRGLGRPTREERLNLIRYLESLVE